MLIRAAFMLIRAASPQEHPLYFSQLSRDFFRCFQEGEVVPEVDY